MIEWPTILEKYGDGYRVDVFHLTFQRARIAITRPEDNRYTYEDGW